MKNYLFSAQITKEAQALLKEDLKNVKTLVCIPAQKDITWSKMAFFEGTQKYPAPAKIFASISNIKTQILLDQNTPVEEAKKLVKNADAILLGGGDPYWQLELIKDKGLVDLLKNHQGLIMGISAGSMNQAKTAYYCKDENSPITKTYEGLGLVNVTIDPHYDLNNKEQVKEHNKWKQKLPIIGLPEESFIVIENKEVKYYGKNYQ